MFYPSSNSSQFLPTSVSTQLHSFSLSFKTILQTKNKKTPRNIKTHKTQIKANKQMIITNKRKKKPKQSK